jgi:protein SMG8
LALSNYSELLPHHYSKSYHESKLDAALAVFRKYARGPEAQRLEEKLKDNCESIWMNGKQQCEVLSLRENPCIMVAKHTSTEGSSHSSGIIYVSTCNCGKTQGRREDPYTVRKANYEFYQLMTSSCATCEKSSFIEFPVFVPSIMEFKAAEVTNKNLTSLILSEYSNKTPTDDKATEHQLHLSASQKTQESESDLSLGSSISDEERTSKKNTKKQNDSDDEDMNEIVVKIGELDVKEEQAEASTTEYLPGMLLITSPPGLLPQFPSMSLMCISSSSFYSHNTGLTENQMPGFLSGTNFLLPWDVKVRLEHAQSWAENYEKNRSRKKQKQLSNHPQGSSGTFFTLKIFVGFEYECGRGHRFMMSSNDTVLRGLAGGSRSNGCGSKVVFSDMPLYFPCPCKNNSIAQLIRVHIVTPKAPVNINIDPRIRIRRETEMIFATGWNEPAKLSQSAYWVLRLPYVYQGENDPIMPPIDVPATNLALRYGCLVQGMFSIKENETNE